MDTEVRPFGIELPNLITLLGQHLYSEPDVFIREVIQNSHDSIVARKVYARSASPAPRIDIDIDSKSRRLSVSDNGKGLTKTEIIEDLAMIGGSGTDKLRRELRDRGRAISLIGQFGIGLLSCFIVAERITIQTKSKDDEALRWQSDGSQNYTIDGGSRTDVGTTLTLDLRPDFSYYLNPLKIRQIVRRYSDFIGIPIYLPEEDHPVNSVDAPWHRARDATAEAEARDFEFWTSRFPHEVPLHIFPVDESIETVDPDTRMTRTGHIRGILAITDRVIPDPDALGTVDLYSQRTFISEANRDILPPWAKFIQGVIECDELSLNIARESIIRNENLTRIQDALGLKITSELSNLLSRDRERFVEIMKWHHLSIIIMALHPDHTEFFRSIADLVPLECGNERITVAEYLKSATRGSDGIPIIYCISNRGGSVLHQMRMSTQGIKAFSGPLTWEFLQKYLEMWPGKAHLSRYDLASAFDPPTEKDLASCQGIEETYRSLFPDSAYRPKIVRFKPNEIPALLSEASGTRRRREIDELATDPRLPARYRDILKQAIGSTPEQMDLNFNIDNSLIQRLTTMNLRTSVGQSVIRSLHYTAILVHRATAMDDQTVERILAEQNQSIEMLLNIADENAMLTAHVLAQDKTPSESGDRVSLTEHVSCFVALPYGEEHADRLYRALKEVLEKRPYYWQLVRADDSVEQPGLWENLRNKMTRAHCFIAIISGNNPNVMIEVGRMEALGRPILLLQQAEDGPLPSDLMGRLYEVIGNDDGHELAERVRETLRKQSAFTAQRGEPFLSTRLLIQGGLSEDVAASVANEFSSCRAFVAADPEAVARQLGLAIRLVGLAQEIVADVLTTQA
jgi:molecular chaperone HtpG